MEIIKPQSGRAFILRKNELLYIETPEAEQVCDLLCFNLHDPSEVLSCGHTIDYNDTIYISKNHSLYSQNSNKMLTILEDTCGIHDLLLTPCSLKMFQLVNSNDEHHPSCHENLCTSLNAFGISNHQVTNTFNIFMNVKVSAEGRIRIEPPRSKAQDLIVLKAEMDLIVGLTACSHEETNHFSCKPIHYQIALSSLKQKTSPELATID